MDHAALGKEIRKRRRALSLTQSEFAAQAGVSLSFLGHIERGSRKASIDTLVKIAQAARVSTDELLGTALAHGVPCAYDGRRAFQTIREALDRLESAYGKSRLP